MGGGGGGRRWRWPVVVTVAGGGDRRWWRWPVSVVVAGGGDGGRWCGRWRWRWWWPEVVSVTGGGGGRRWCRWPEVVVAGGGGGGRRMWPVAVMAGEEGRKGYIRDKRLVPLSSTYFGGTSVFHLCSTSFLSVPPILMPNMGLTVLVPVCSTQSQYQTHPKGRPLKLG